jgi:hypothetical protein
MLQTYVAITQAINEVENQDGGLYAKRVNEVNPPPPPPPHKKLLHYFGNFFQKLQIPSKSIVEFMVL